MKQVNSLSEYKKDNIYPHLLGLLVLIYFIVFLKLNSFQMRWWDESMFAVNTYEMLHNGKFFSPHFNFLPDLYNTKPPLTSWIQMLFVKIVGYNELALRLPSAITAALSILLLFKFIATHYNLIWAWLSALILLTSPGFIGFHTARTADSDSLLTFFLLVANINFIKYIIMHHKKCIFLFMLFISLAFAIKMYAAFLFIPAYVIILIQQKQLKQFISNKNFWLGLSFLVFSIISLMGLRELDAPGYIKTALFKDAGRIFTSVENHREPAIFYFNNLFTNRFSIWFILLIAGLLFALFSEKKEHEKKLLYIFLLLSLAYFLIITMSVTKLIWYDMPLYPYFAAISAYPLYLFLQKFHFFPKVSATAQLVFIIICIFSYPYLTMFEKSQANVLDPGEKILEANERYIFERMNEQKNLNGIKVFYSGYNGSLIFYKYKLAETGQKIELVNDAAFNVNDKVLVADENLKLLLSQKYNCKTIDGFGNASLLLLTGKN